MYSVMEFMKNYSVTIVVVSEHTLAAEGASPASSTEPTRTGTTEYMTGCTVETVTLLGTAQPIGAHCTACSTTVQIV